MRPQVGPHAAATSGAKPGPKEKRRRNTAAWALQRPFVSTRDGQKAQNWANHTQTRRKVCAHTAKPPFFANILRKHVCLRNFAFRATTTRRNGSNFQFGATSPRINGVIFRERPRQPGVNFREAPLLKISKTGSRRVNRAAGVIFPEAPGTGAQGNTPEGVIPLRPVFRNTPCEPGRAKSRKGHTQRAQGGA